MNADLNVVKLCPFNPCRPPRPYPSLPGVSIPKQVSRAVQARTPSAARNSPFLRNQIDLHLQK